MFGLANHVTGKFEVTLCDQGRKWTHLCFDVNLLVRDPVLVCDLEDASKASLMEGILFAIACHCLPPSFTCIEGSWDYSGGVKPYFCFQQQFFLHSRLLLEYGISFSNAEHCVLGGVTGLTDGIA